MSPYAGSSEVGATATLTVGTELNAEILLLSDLTPHTTMMFSFPAEKTPPQEASRQPRPKRAKIGVAFCGPCAIRKSGVQACVYGTVRLKRPPACRMCPASTQTHPTASISTDKSRYSTGAQIQVSEGEDEDAERLPRGGLFGASSGATILDEAGDMSGQKAKSKTNLVYPKPLKELPRMRKRTRQEPSDVQFAIPPRKVADHLLNLYWDFVDSAYPWLDRLSIESAYETLWSTDGELCMDERALHCLLNLMFATSCVASQGDSPLSRYQSSGVFFERAQELMAYVVMDIYNFETIQILLLTAVYLQHEKMPERCFRSIATAIHIAQELGLHLPVITKAILDPRERDLAHQVWNGCVIMDRICAMTFGCALKVPQSLAKEGLNSMTLAGENEILPSKVNFYMSFCRLHYIIGEVLEAFYISSDTSGLNPTVPSLIDLPVCSGSSPS
ncbi:fungal specific transcription factor domain-containing protein [Aspergillus mulundensis]|uniref:Xylanolytic transcriptional activator regulatory domain-containing protein n=1 Tax=Aspergillus mulundensis TaxID=1810919 RepID=A0A3D8RZ70_9EURO|nr:hypothetical protein DSM5745_05983 [Aspergillus mulundensis]RDW79131.1 hypothetical protein DSM5745_05983 [Aspergillus mulundensis]